MDLSSEGIIQVKEKLITLAEFINRGEVVPEEVINATGFSAQDLREIENKGLFRYFELLDDPYSISEKQEEFLRLYFRDDEIDMFQSSLMNYYHNHDGLSDPYIYQSKAFGVIFDNFLEEETTYPLLNIWKTYIIPECPYDVQFRFYGSCIPYREDDQYARDIDAQWARCRAAVDSKHKLNYANHHSEDYKEVLAGERLRKKDNYRTALSEHVFETDWDYIQRKFGNIPTEDRIKAVEFIKKHALQYAERHNLAKLKIPKNTKVSSPAKGSAKKEIKRNHLLTIISFFMCLAAVGFSFIPSLQGEGFAIPEKMIEITNIPHFVFYLFIFTVFAYILAIIGRAKCHGNIFLFVLSTICLAVVIRFCIIRVLELAVSILDEVSYYNS